MSVPVIAAERERAGIDAQAAAHDLRIRGCRCIREAAGPTGSAPARRWRASSERNSRRTTARLRPTTLSMKRSVVEPVEIGELVALQIGVVRGELHVEAGAPDVIGRGTRPEPNRLLIQGCARRRWRAARRRSRECPAATGRRRSPALAIFALQHRARLRGDERIERQIAAKATARRNTGILTKDPR